MGARWGPISQKNSGNKRVDPIWFFFFLAEKVTTFMLFAHMASHKVDGAERKSYIGPIWAPYGAHMGYKKDPIWATV